MAAKISPFDRVKIIKQEKPGLEFVAGKWFYNEVEILNIRKYAANLDCLKFKSPSEIDDFIEAFILKEGKEEGRWYDNEIIKAAKEKDPSTIPGKLAFPLTLKQLKIINVLLFRPEEEVFFICSGVGGSGKSTFGNIVCQLFQNDISATSLRDLTNDFSVAEAVKHRLIYSTELSASDVAEMDNKVIKQLASKEIIYVNPKGTVGYNVKTQSSLLFNCNNEPKVDLTDTGILRRIIYYYRTKKIDNPDLSLKDKKFTKQELIDIAARAYNTDMTDWRKDFEQETHLRLISNNSVYITNEYDNYWCYKEKCQHIGIRAYSEPKWSDICSLVREWGLDNDTKRL